MKILVVDDDQPTRDVVCEILQEDGFEVRSAKSGEEALERLRENEFAIVLSDIRMAQLDGMKLLSSIKSGKLDSVVILMTAFGSAGTTIEAISKGAFDYIGKPFRVEHLKSVVQRAAQHYESLHQASPISALDREGDHKLIGKSPQMVEVYKTAGRAALSDSSILVLGESGTGKELIARLIHENGARKDKAFIPVNCGALAENLLESELFGHVKGAFTGAVCNKRGLLEEADQGTLFLDEIADMPLSLQVKVLRVLQEGEIKPVGSNEMRHVRVRIIAATHQDLESLVKQGRFREDLYYRLRVLTLRLPPLRDRREDLPDLIGHFVARHSARSGKPISEVSEEALRRLTRYPWPGNVRELEHSLERAIAMTRTTVLFPEDFPDEIGHFDGAPTTAASEIPPKSLDEMEKEHILGVLKSVHFNKVEAAKVLGISRVTLYRKAKRYGLALDSKK